METSKSITKIRKEKGYNQIQISELLKTTQQQYSKYERGEQEIPVRHIKTLCEFYKVPANKLIGIEVFMSEKESNNKFLEFYDQMEDMLAWAYSQDHITEDQMILLLRNMYTIKEDIEKS